jgi:hypothetical protein
MSVLRRAHVEVEPDVTGFDTSLREKFAKLDPGGKAGKQLGGQLNRALKRLDLDPVDVRADPKKALAAIDETERKLRALSNNASTVEIKVRAQQGLGEISRFRKQLGDVGEEGASGFFAKFSARLGPLMASLPIQGPLGIAVAGAAATAAPFLGAAVSAAVIGGAGIGGVVGGLTLAAKDARVQAATVAFGDRLERRLAAAAGGFIEPAIAGVGRLERSLDTIDFEKIFGDAERFVDPLARGVGSLIEDLGGGLEKLVANADGPIAAISEGIASIGQHLGEGLEMLAENGENATDALVTLFAVVNSSLDSVFLFVDALNDLYEINKAIGGDLVLQTFLAATGSAQSELGDETEKTTSKFRAFSGTIETGEEVLKRLGGASKVGADQLDLLLGSTGLVTAKMQAAKQTAELMRKAIDEVSGAAIGATEANEGYAAAWDALSASVQGNGKSLDINTAKGRSNRDALQALLLKNNESYVANIANGQSIAQATRKHEARTVAVQKEAIKLGLGKKATQELITVYGRIPAKKSTDLVVQGFKGIERILADLYAYQRSLASGISLSAARNKIASELHGGFAGDASAFHRAGGGPIFGAGTSTSDSIPALLSNDEHVWTAREVQAVGGHAAMKRMRESALDGDLPAFAAGGGVLAGAWPRDLRYGVDVRGSRIPSRAEVAAKVFLPVPSGGRTSDWIVQAARALVPGIRVLSKDRPGARTLSGNQSYHALGRAVDFEYSERLARLWNQRYGSRTKEEITPYQRWNLHNGQRHTYTGAIWNQHNFAGGNPHDHIAMDDGGLRALKPGMNLVQNGTGRPELIGGPAALAAAGEVHIHIHDSVIASERQAVDLVARAYKQAVYERKITLPSGKS